MATGMPASPSMPSRKSQNIDNFSQNETQFNSFLFNIAIRNAVGSAVQVFLCLMMRNYTEGTAVYLLSYEVDGSSLFFNVAGVSWYFWGIMIMVMLTSVFLVFMKNGRIRYGDEIKEQKIDDKEELEKTLVESDSE